MPRARTPRERCVLALMDAAMRSPKGDQMPIDSMYGYYLDSLPSDALIDLLIERGALAHAAYRYDTGHRPGGQEGPNYGFVPHTWDEETIEQIGGEKKPAKFELLYVRADGAGQS